MAPADAGQRSYVGVLDGARYRVVVPANWNGTLVVWSHGTYSPDGQEPAELSLTSQPATEDWLVGHGYALAASGFRHVLGWSIADGYVDQIRLMDWFSVNVGAPRRVVSAGASAGGATATGLAERSPGRFGGVVTECGMLAGGLAYWNSGLDLMFAVRTLLGGDFALVKPTDPGNEDKAAAVIDAAAQGTPQQQAKLALANALADVPGWFDPTKPRPTSIAEQVSAMSIWDTAVRTGAVGVTRTDMERWAGGNPTWNIGVDYRVLLARSSELAFVRQAYAAAGLDLSTDLDRLAAAPRIAPDLKATAYLLRTSQPFAEAPWPVVGIRDTADGVLPIANDTPYAARTDRPANLRQLAVDRAGHCALTASEEITAFQTLFDRMDTGRWPATDPDGLNTRARALGPETQVVWNPLNHDYEQVPTAFTRHVSVPYPR
ncbi:hypothetical protein EV192_1011545 [Actinocrispum wychmicini]|uniref:Uncharacterized protein n=1 Tax=Actinocrispum wychmicini TaxID=1213861 RepID=A0A4R2JYR5_9PSEU|nr:hypothetical protein EV192_1011545 [Actinocrispum wychmicini]